MSEQIEMVVLMALVMRLGGREQDWKTFLRFDNCPLNTEKVLKVCGALVQTGSLVYVETVLLGVIGGNDDGLGTLWTQVEQVFKIFLGKSLGLFVKVDNVISPSALSQFADLDCMDIGEEGSDLDLLIGEAAVTLSDVRCLDHVSRIGIEPEGLNQGRLAGLDIPNEQDIDLLQVFSTEINLLFLGWILELGCLGRESNLDLLALFVIKFGRTGDGTDSFKVLDPGVQVYCRCSEKSSSIFFPKESLLGHFAHCL